MLKNNQNGQSILEVIIAMAIFALVASAMMSLALGGFTALEQGGEQTQAEALAQEGIEAVKSIREGAWNENTYTTSSVAVAGGQWVFSGEGTTETIGQFTRTISFADVCRDGSDNIATCPATYTDVHSKQATVSVTWGTLKGTSNTVQKVAYITNWDSRDWTQTDWSGGSGQSIWSNATKYDSAASINATSTAGQVGLLSGDTLDDGLDLPTGTSYDWPFTTAGNYTYNSSKIQVTGGKAELKQSGGITSSGDTLNPDFDTNTNNWTYTDWEQSGGLDVTGSRVASGGNPNGYVNINMPGKKNDTASGFWEQSFATTVANPSVATTTLDWIVTQYSANLLTSFQLYAFVDSVSGAPILGTEIWSSGEITATTSWAGVSAIDISSKLGGAGTYYLKIATRRITIGGTGSAGTNTVGFDNVGLHWEHTTGGTYPTDRPDIYPTSSFTASGIQSWNSFTETAIKNGGEIYYQLSDDNGTTWKYWNGSLWVTAGSTNYNTASVVNTNISNLSPTSGQIKFRAFLESNGSQLVQLDNINIGFTAPAPVWSFSTWDVDAGEVTPTGTRQTSSGNPGNYIDIMVPSGNNDKVGGYWEQRFTTYRNSPTPVTVDFNYKVVDFNGSPTVAHVRIYIDTSSGTPANQVGSSISISGEGLWTSAAQINAAAAVPTVGTYYLKVAFWVETAGGSPGPFTVGFDNVNINLGNGEYLTSGTVISSAFDMSGISPVQTVEWDQTIPPCSPVCTITIDVASAPNSGGVPGTWTAWQNASTAKNTLLPIALNGNQWVRYRANLTGDGDDTPVLTEVRVNYK